MFATAKTVRISNLSRDDMVERLEEKGWTALGSGYYSRAFAPADRAHPLYGRAVWKVSNFRWQKDAYWTFLQAIMAGLISGPHLPRVKAAVKLKDGRFAVLLERLVTKEDFEGMDPVPDNGWTPRVGGHRHAWSQWRYYLQAALHGEDLERPVFAQAKEDLGTAVADMLREAGKLIAGGRDLHGGNFMLRRARFGGWTVVVTDPFSACSTESVNKRRLSYKARSLTAKLRKINRDDYNVTSLQYRMAVAA